MEVWKNAWVELDMSAYTAAQLLAFFAIEPGSAEYNNLTRARQLILLATRQANPEINPAGGIRMWRSKTNNKKYLLYVLVPESLADELRSLPPVFNGDEVRYLVGNLQDLPDSVHAEYWTGVVGTRVILNPSVPGYDPNASYRYINVFWGVEP